MTSLATEAVPMIELGYILRSAKTHAFLPAPPSLPTWLPPATPRSVAELKAQGWGDVVKGTKGGVGWEGGWAGDHCLIPGSMRTMTGQSLSVTPRGIYSSLPSSSPLSSGECIFDVLLTNRTYFENAVLGIPAFLLEDDFTHLHASMVRASPLLSLFIPPPSGSPVPSCFPPLTLSCPTVQSSPLVLGGVEECLAVGPMLEDGTRAPTPDWADLQVKKGKGGGRRDRGKIYFAQIQ